MLLNLVSNLRELKWSNAALELFVVALGILMAFQVDRWWEARDDRTNEQHYIERLTRDLGKDVENLTYAIELASFRSSLAELLMDVVENPELATDKPVDFLIAINQAAFTYTPTLNSNTFEELKSTGNLRMLQNAALRNALFEYYRYDEGQRQYLALNFMQEFRHFELGAGILSRKQSTRSVRDWYVANPDRIDDFRIHDVDPKEIIETTDRFRANQDFIAWLPIAYGMQLEHIDVNTRRLDNANALLELLRNEHIAR